MRSFLMMMLCFLPLHSALSATIEVPKDFSNIQQAIDMAQNGDTVLVSDGFYYDNLDFKKKAITVKSKNGPDKTIIDGIYFASVVTFKSGEGPDSVLEGFTLQNGAGTPVYTPFYEYYGGGILCNGASPTIRNNIISNNNLNKGLPNTSRGGGMGCINGASPLVEHNIIRKNRADVGGGIVFTHKSSPLIRFNQIHDNTSSAGLGGGLNCNSEDTAYEVTCNWIYDNWGLMGGGVYCSGDGYKVCGNLIYSNKSKGYGGGLFCEGSWAILTNNTVYNNSSAVGPGGGGLYSNCDKTEITNSIFWRNHAKIGKEIYIQYQIGQNTELKISHSDVQGGLGSIHIANQVKLTWGSNMWDQEPEFVDADQNDFHWHRYCMNGNLLKGDPSAPGLTPFDLDGNPRISEGHVNMGADQLYTHLYYTGEAKPGGVVDIKIVSFIMEGMVLGVNLNVLPNPIPTSLGDWYLPVQNMIWITEKNKYPDWAIVIPMQIPRQFPLCDVYMQAMTMRYTGNSLTDLCVLSID